MPRDFSGGSIATLLLSIVKSEQVEVKDTKLKKKLTDTLLVLESELSDCEYEEDDDANETYVELENYFIKLEGDSHEDEDDEDEDDEDEEDDLAFEEIEVELEDDEEVTIFISDDEENKEL